MTAEFPGKESLRWPEHSPVLQWAWNGPPPVKILPGPCAAEKSVSRREILKGPRNASSPNLWCGKELLPNYV